MALPHNEQLIEVACNLLDTSRTSQDVVGAYIRDLASKSGIEVTDAYATNKLPEELVELATQQLADHQ